MLQLKLKAQGCVTADLGSDPLLMKEITRKPLETLGRLSHYYQALSHLAPSAKAKSGVIGWMV